MYIWTMFIDSDDLYECFEISNIRHSFIQLLDFVKPICLPYEDAANEDYHFDADGERQQTWVAGWGVTDIKGKFF